MMGVSNNLKVCHKCCNVASFRGIIWQCDILMDKDTLFSLQGQDMARTCTSSDSIELVVCDDVINLANLLLPMTLPHLQTTWALLFALL